MQNPDECKCGKWIHLPEVDSEREYFLTCRMHNFSDYESACLSIGGEALHSFHGQEETLKEIIYYYRGTMSSFGSQIGLEVKEDTKGIHFFL